MINIGKNLKENRLVFGYTQSALAKATNIKQQNISRWESNTNHPDIMDCIKLANFYGISIEELLGVSDEYFVNANKLTSGADPYSSEERELIEKYRALPDKIKKLVRDQLNVYNSTEELVFKKDKKV